jgi:hypothetical protein
MKLVQGALLVAMGAAAGSLSMMHRAEPTTEPIPSAVVEAPPAPEPVVDLLRRTASRVAVSSEVGDGVDLPSHLVDGRTATAWQSRSGELVGSWIAFRVPRETHVRRIGLYAGYDAISTSGDLFGMNHRIVRVLVRREGVTLADWHLDPGVRTMQTLDVDASGGDFKLEIAEVTAGTKREWNEVCVSELTVLGTAGPMLQDEKAPPVTVGSLIPLAP